MKNKFSLFFFLIVIVLFSCTKSGGGLPSAYGPSYTTADGTSTGAAVPGNGNGDSTTQNEPGLITAGEWNDLSNWQFWTSVIAKPEFDTMPAYWQFFNTKRISVSVAGYNSLPVIDALVKLKKDGTVIFTARTDNSGKAELWVNLFQSEVAFDYSTLSLDINNGTAVSDQVKLVEQGVNNFVISPAAKSNNINIAFVVDATGSMSDELEFLKTDLLDVITTARADNPGTIFSTGSIFYRDEGDDYLTKTSSFTTDINSTIDFIKDQNASGGGDFPEAVHSALDKAVNDLQWSANAKTRLLFLLLDAPPHNEQDVINSLQTSVAKAAEKGIKIIPITASGIDKPTEFIMRFFALSTNGTYVFITNDSGIGDDHLTPTVGPYDVEYLNNLMVRLINKYAE